LGLGFLAAIAMEPIQGTAALGLAEGYRLEGLPEEATLWYVRSATLLGPDDEAPYLGLGQVAEDGGELEAATAYFKVALERNPRNPLGHYLMGKVYRSRGQVAAAIESMERAVALQPDWVEANLELIGLFSVAGRRADVARQYAELRRRYPTLDPDALEEMESTARLLLGEPRRRKA